MELEHFVNRIKEQPGCSLILIGGCSRVGKTTLSAQIAKELSALYHPLLEVTLDAWIVSVEKRPQASTVMERFEVDRMLRDIQCLAQGQQVFPPVYDAKTRRRIVEISSDGLQLQQGTIIVEGVIALAIPELCSLATATIFVEVPDDVRIKRLYQFYTQEKGLKFEEAQKLISGREAEEVPLIKSTMTQADLKWSIDHFTTLNPDFVMSPTKPAF